jgi:hypothetical protein
VSKIDNRTPPLVVDKLTEQSEEPFIIEPD